MSVNLNALKQYQKVGLASAVEHASPKQLISMLLEGALTALAKAKGAIDRSEIEVRTEQLNKASDIVLGLKDFLDLENGGEVAENLDALYDYMVRTIMQANRENNGEQVQEVMNLLLEVKTGWDQMELSAE
ncbi:flagellar export chaperone FliS [Amphritea balenae]|uniref:Flagellar secretion chaperone FliS n=1 Tax=Amphritea balenae TaxID=452629 RepID=A0A3P1SQC2_9GAMM|nr:flagellar export chaperone FliS [Amphritea balenae]RRC99249.1 flagellar export chaperone FliS [Amphritea balenae]GGK72740.1 flagellar protein FliS [Amphritea balenae]